jgi:membrane-associated phospholipid phosphatase
MPLDEVMRDTTALGGLAVYGFAALLFLLLGEARIFWLLVIGLVLCYAIISPIRLIFFRRRPDKQQFSGVFTKIDASSFPSMHSARSTVLAIVLTQAFPQPSVRALLALGVLAVVVTRVLLKRHFVSDVIGGVVVGAVVGWLTLFVAPFVL